MVHNLTYMVSRMVKWVINSSHQRREGTAKGLQFVQNHTFPRRHRAIL